LIGVALVGVLRRLLVGHRGLLRGLLKVIHPVSFRAPATVQEPYQIDPETEIRRRARAGLVEALDRLHDRPGVEPDRVGGRQAGLTFGGGDRRAGGSFIEVHRVERRPR
jgi:hypothetical protein